uniref:FBA_2 domain-containing protein n=1 Tax=Steinernema glaseri TaxID=37863 RepID=A0A1I8A889_9BILA
MDLWSLESFTKVCFSPSLASPSKSQRSHRKCASLAHSRVSGFDRTITAMDSVPNIFIESVCASLSRESLEDLEGCRSALWNMGAKDMSRKAKEVRIDVSVCPESLVRSYTTYTDGFPTSLDDLRRTKYARISMHVVPWNTRPAVNDRLNSLFAYVSTRHVEELSMMSVDHIDSLFQNFLPLSVISTIKIWSCTFEADSAFPEWLRRTLRSNSLQDICIIGTTIEGRSEDVEEDLIHQSLIHGKRLKICMDGNRNFTNLKTPFLRRILELWTNSEKPFPREVSYHIPYHCIKEMIAVQREYIGNEESGTLLHKSGSGKVTWERFSITFRP